jgi:DNA helicase-2/ATP-dependent DNA helicase PcrA
MANLGIDTRASARIQSRTNISSAKNELIEPKEYTEFANGRMQEIVAKVYPEYERILKNNQALDFDDLILKVVKIFRDFPEILKTYQNQFKYIHIDEYQDTNHAQYMLAKLLAASHKNVCVVGDDWQSIYSWRGANFKNILDFEKDYPNAKIIKLEQNYRSTKNILKAADSIIRKNISRSDKKLVTDNSSGTPVFVYEAGSEEDEGRFIIDEIKEITSTSDRNLSDFAVLYRTNAQSRSLEEEFLKSGMKYRIYGGVRFYERREVKDMVAYLRFIANPSDTIALERIINIPTRGIGAVSFRKIKALAEEYEFDLLKTKVIESRILSAKSQAEFDRFVGLIEKFQKLKGTMKLSEYLEKVMRDSGYYDWLDDDTTEGEDRQENLKELLSVAEEISDR